ncbi:DUF5710 domain-containing protein (plasmid) [Pseudomonas sp. FeN3W]|nr:DUF5710 domain-containing protein [Pseudomonas sp. FeN3W]
MTFYHVSFNDKDLAKKLGAKFNFDLKLWYAPNDAVSSAMSAQFKPMADDEVDDLRLVMGLEELKGEDRSFGGNGLFVDLIPASCFFKNVRSDIKESHWRVLSKLVRARAGGQCEICGAAEDPESGNYLDAHELWHYDNATRVQKLMRIVSLCKSCHLYTHMGYANIQGKAEEAIAHKIKVSGLSRAEVDQEIEAAFKLWEQRNRGSWKLDLGILTDSGVRVLLKGK